MESLKTKNFIVNKNISLAEIPTSIELDFTKKEKQKALKEIGKKLSKLQDTMYAHNKYSVLVCLQGMDAAGKDSLIREVFKNFNARGVVVHSFKAPNTKELKHDYLWRHYIALPEKGKYAIFNRSHYENVLITRVNPQFILAEKNPEIQDVEDVDDKFWEDRFQQIRNFEKHIAQNGTIIFKFFLNLSKEEQRLRLLRRLETKKHIWKFDPSDITERKLWDDYQKYYEEAINKTSKPHAPWFIIPADDKDTARYLVAKCIYDTTVKYTDITEPEPSDEVIDNLKSYKNQLSTKAI
jgi:PPK2 family polyphosphate:nucleotide phosphotransferase